MRTRKSSSGDSTTLDPYIHIAVNHLGISRDVWTTAIHEREMKTVWSNGKKVRKPDPDGKIISITIIGKVV